MVVELGGLNFGFFVVLRKRLSYLEADLGVGLVGG